MKYHENESNERIFIKVLSLYGKEGLREEASYNRCKPEEAEEA